MPSHAGVELMQKQICNSSAECAASCTYSAWSPLYASSKACRGGTQTATRTASGISCGAVTQTRLCNVPVPSSLLRGVSERCATCVSLLLSVF